MNKPIFIIGCPRSGTSLALDIIARHEELAWVSNLLDKKPVQLYRTRINRIYDLPWFGDFLYRAMTQSGNSNKLPKILRGSLSVPVEAWSFWSFYLKNFQWQRFGPIPPRQLTRDDISPDEVSRIRKTVEAICRYQNKPRFISKYTDFPRITYLSAAFPDAFFIHIVRDGRAVAASYLKQIETGAFGTWNEREWWIKGWPEPWRDEWRNRYNTPLGFVAYQWKFFLREICEDAKEIDDKQYIEVKYDDIVGDPHSTFDRIFGFCELKKSKRVNLYLDRIHLDNNDDKWKNMFTEEEKEILNNITGEGKNNSLMKGEK